MVLRGAQNANVVAMAAFPKCLTALSKSQDDIFGGVLHRVNRHRADWVLARRGRWRRNLNATEETLKIAVKLPMTDLD
jgi:hypothetical protein